MNTEKMRNIAPAIVRIGIALVILWFSSQQLSNPGGWVVLIPSWATNISGMSAQTLVTLNGAAELVIGGLLLFGFYTRILALLSALHLFMITFVVGYNAIGVRDFGLALAATSSFFYGVDAFCLDAYLAKRKIARAVGV